jgi:hypothetical protein
MSTSMFIARSLVFYPGYFEDKCTELSDEVILPSHYLNRLIDEFDSGEMLYLTITNTDRALSALVTIGSPHTHDKNTIFAPQWVLELIGCSGNCNSVISIEKADVTDIPVAKKIIIRPLDPVAFELDTLACFEKAFMNLHSIKEGITIPVPVPELGTDYKMYAHIEKVEPAGLSRIVEGEVDVEFINDFTDAPTSTISTTTTRGDPTPTPMPTPNFGAVLPEAAAPEPAVMPLEQLTAEQRRQQVRDAWLKRYQNTAE